MRHCSAKLNQNDKRKMMKGLYIVPLAAATLLLSACATTVKPTYVSPTQYQSLSCQQLQSEYNRIQQYIDNGVQTPKVQVWVLDSGLAVAGTRRLGIRPIHLCQYGTIFFNQKHRTFTCIRSTRSHCSGCSVQELSNYCSEKTN